MAKAKISQAAFSQILSEYHSGKVTRNENHSDNEFASNTQAKSEAQNISIGQNPSNQFPCSNSDDQSFSDEAHLISRLENSPAHQELKSYLEQKTQNSQSHQKPASINSSENNSQDSIEFQDGILCQS